LEKNKLKYDFILIVIIIIQKDATLTQFAAQTQNKNLCSEKTLCLQKKHLVFFAKVIFSNLT